MLLGISVSGQTRNDTINLDQCEIKSVSNPVVFRDLSRSVQVITTEQLKQSPIHSLDDILRYFGGVDIRSRGAFGVQSDVNFSGGTFDQALMMVDGIALNDPQTGHHNLCQAVDMENIEMIEIFEGPGNRLFGANSFSGGINIIRNKSKKQSVNVSLSGGQYGYFSGYAGVNYSLGKVKNHTSASLSKSDGYITNTDFEIINANHSSSLATDFGDFNLNIGVLDKGMGANSFYTSTYPDQYEHIRTYFSSLGFTTGEKIKYSQNVFWRRNYDRFELFREDNDWYKKQGDVFVFGSDTAGYPTSSGLYPYKGHNYHRTDILGTDAGLNFNTAAGNTALGLGLKSERIVSNVLGDPMSDTIFIPNSDGFYTKSKIRNSISFSVNQNKSFNRLMISAGVSSYYNDDYGLFLSPGIDIGYFLTDNSKLFISSNKAIRLPTFTDLYYQGPSNISNPDLNPEKAISSEIGYKYFSSNITASVSTFYRNGTDIIDWIKYPDDEKWQSANLTELNTLGVNVSFNSMFTGKFVNFLGFKYTWLTSDKNDTDFVSMYALDYLKHNLNIYLDHNIIKDFSASWTFTWQERNGEYIDAENGQATAYIPVVLVNLKLLYRIKDLEFNIQANNLLNREYYDIGNIRQPGIWLTGGVSFNRVFEKKNN